MKIASGSYFSVALLQSGLVLYWGKLQFAANGIKVKKPIPVHIGLRFRDVVAGHNFVFGITHDHIVYAWGELFEYVQCIY